MRATCGYLGAIQVQPGEFSWLLYDSTLPPVYRIVGTELRLMYREYEIEIEDNRDHQQLEAWRERHLFSRLAWEDIGGRGTFFDPYDNPERNWSGH